MALLSALGHLANVGQFVEIGQGHAHQKEQIRWTHRNYRLDVQALKIDLLGAARDDVRGTYDTYIERLDTLLLVNALLLPFALNTLQFSDEFLPRTEEECVDCVEAAFPQIVTLWVYLVGFSVVMPFWSLLLLLWCKMRMDHWLQLTLAELQNLRRDIITRPANEQPAVPDENAYAEHEEIVATLGSFIVEYQDFFSHLWCNKCAPLVGRATQLLWGSAYVSVTLVGVMFWVYLANRHGEQHLTHFHFAGVMVTGLVAPVIAYIVWRARGGASDIFFTDRTIPRCMRTVHGDQSPEAAAHHRSTASSAAAVPPPRASSNHLEVPTSSSGSRARSPAASPETAGGPAMAPSSRTASPGRRTVSLGAGVRAVSPMGWLTGRGHDGREREPSAREMEIGFRTAALLAG